MTLAEIIAFYINCLIIQYHNKPKAQATIQLLISELLMSGVFFDVRDGYAVESAIGKQLDIIGKYVGTDRFYVTFDPINYFGLTFYTDVDPDSQEKFGFVQYSNSDEFQYNGTLNYNSLLNQSNVLSDEDFRIIIFLKILQNNINHSHKAIDDAVFSIFGDSIVPDSTGGMQMVYFISADFTAVIGAALVKNLLPRPMGVGLTLISGIDNPFFGFATYTYTPENNIGFTDYAEYPDSEGAFLVYSQMG